MSTKRKAGFFRTKEVFEEAPPSKKRKLNDGGEKGTKDHPIEVDVSESSSDVEHPSDESFDLSLEEESLRQYMEYMKMNESGSDGEDTIDEDDLIEKKEAPLAHYPKEVNIKETSEIPKNVSQEEDRRLRLKKQWSEILPKLKRTTCDCDLGGEHCDYHGFDDGDDITPSSPLKWAINLSQDMNDILCSS